MYSISKRIFIIVLMLLVSQSINKYEYKEYLLKKQEIDANVVETYQKFKDILIDYGFYEKSDNKFINNDNILIKIDFYDDKIRQNAYKEIHIIGEFEEHNFENNVEKFLEILSNLTNIHLENQKEKIVSLKDKFIVDKTRQNYYIFPNDKYFTFNIDYVGEISLGEYSDDRKPEIEYLFCIKNFQ